MTDENCTMHDCAMFEKSNNVLCEKTSLSANYGCTFL